jgi:Tfp pilus assembly protein PilX
MKRVDIKKIENNQDGMASILITILMMIVVSLVVLGFSQVTRNEQRESLNRQLSMQAFYAAESGVNDAYKVISSDISTGTAIQPQTSCNSGDSDDVLSQSPGQRITCLLVNPSPSTLYYRPTTQQSQVGYINSNSVATGTNPVGNIVISWQNTTYDSNNVFDCGVGRNLPPASGGGSWKSNCGAGILRVDIVPAENISENSSGVSTYFLYPNSTVGSLPSVSYGSSNGALVSAYCKRSASPNACQVEITNLTGTDYYIRMSAIYTDAVVGVASKTSGTQFYRGEVEIDSTGEISSVFRRLVVYTPTTNNGYYPDNPLQTSESVCKQYGYIPGSAADLMLSVLPNCPN